MDILEGRKDVFKYNLYFIGSMFRMGLLNYKRTIGKIINILSRLEREEEKILYPFLEIITKFELDGDFRKIQLDKTNQNKLKTELRKAFFEFIYKMDLLRMRY